MTFAHALILIGAGLLGGATAAMAGGASLVTFPILLAIGLAPLQANITNNLGLAPASVSAALSSGPELAGQHSRLWALAMPAIAGTAIGVVALLAAPPGVFQAIVPFLIIASCLLLLGQPWLLSRSGHRLLDVHRRGVPAVAFAVSIYTGYFGAASGVLLLALLGLFTQESIHRQNATKNVIQGLAGCTAVISFILLAPIDWPAVGVLAAGSVAGGSAGVRLARLIPATPLRLGIAFAGLTVAGWLLARGH
jgi:uncharacterized membrane protein YfcA